MASLKSIRDERLEKLNELRKAGLDPYPAKSDRTHELAQIHEDFESLESSRAEVVLTGRVMSIRAHGGSTFLTFEDSTGSLQALLRQDSLGDEKYDMLGKYLDIGDFIELNGVIIKTKRGENTIDCTGFSILSKAIRPLPEKWSGLKDQEKRYRRRYVDLILNKDARDIFRKRTQLIHSFRESLHKEEFLEVEIPVLEHTTGGADAEPFVTHHNRLDTDFFLRISLELPLKRLLVGGMDKVYELGRVFRNEGLSTEHLQEFTMLEFYWAYKDYNFGMDFVEKMYADAVKAISGSNKITFRDQELDFTPPWPRESYIELFKKYTDIDLNTVSDKEALVGEVKSKLPDAKIDTKSGYGRVIDQVYKQYVRPNLIGPMFLTDQPLSISPLAKKHSDNNEFTERFQVLIAASEVGNGFSELNDPVDQKERFEEQMLQREAGDKEAHMMDEDYVEALEYGMPPAFGFGVGIDRLLMILTDSSTIRDVVLFPMMKQKDK